MRRRVIHGRHVSSLRVIFAGVSQGSTLGPLLYSIFINDMVEFFSSKGFDLEVGLAAGLLNTLLYADDTTLLAENPPRLQEMLHLLEAYSITWYWQVNVPKSHIMGILPSRCDLDSQQSPVITSGYTVATPDTTQQIFTIYGTQLAVVTEFKNLGIEFTMGHDRWATFLSRSLLSARGASFYISRFVQSGMLLSPRIVRYLSQSMVHSICEYGVQIWGPFLCSQAGLRQHLHAIDTMKFSVLRSSQWAFIGTTLRYLASPTGIQPALFYYELTWELLLCATVVLSSFLLIGIRAWRSIRIILPSPFASAGQTFMP